jgi:glycosyltransferase involved in cell wall biosynthesis
LARELYRRRHLERIYSTFPRFRLRREGLPAELVETFPWIHTSEFALAKFGWDWPRVSDQLGYWNALAFDRWTERRLPPCDALIGLAGSCLRTGRLVQERGGIFICDRGSTHQRYQERIVSEEYARWGLSRPVSDIRDTLREEAIYAMADAITVPSHLAARTFVELGIPEAKMHVIPYGVRLENFHPTSPPVDGTFEALFAGAAGLRKGLPYLLEAFARVDHPRKRLRIAGGVQPEMRGLLAHLPQQHVEWLGVLGQDALRDAMSSSHLLVLPSIEEGLALVQAQAMACGCPVLCSTNTGGEDLFADGVEGFIVPIRDVDALTTRMQQVASDPALQQRLRTAALERVRTIGGWKEYGDRWEELLYTMTGARK